MGPRAVSANVHKLLTLVSFCPGFAAVNYRIFLKPSASSFLHNWFVLPSSYFLSLEPFLEIKLFTDLSNVVYPTIPKE